MFDGVNVGDGQVTITLNPDPACAPDQPGGPDGPGASPAPIALELAPRFTG